MGSTRASTSSAQAEAQAQKSWITYQPPELSVAPARTQYSPRRLYFRQPERRLQTGQRGQQTGHIPWHYLIRRHSSRPIASHCGTASLAAPPIGRPRCCAPQLQPRLHPCLPERGAAAVTLFCHDPDLSPPAPTLARSPSPDSALPHPASLYKGKEHVREPQTISSTRPPPRALRNSLLASFSVKKRSWILLPTIWGRIARHRSPA